MHPDWFARHSILPADETAGLFADPIRKEIPEIGATLEIGSGFLVDQSQAIINFKSFRLKVTREKFEVMCEDSHKFKLLLEFVRKIFFILQETPISAYGFNFLEEFKTEKEPHLILNELFIPAKNINNEFPGQVEFGHKIMSKYDSTKITFAVEKSKITECGISTNFNFHHDLINPYARTFIDSLEVDFQKDIDIAISVIRAYIGEEAERITGNIKR